MVASLSLRMNSNCVRTKATTLDISLSPASISSQSLNKAGRVKAYNSSKARSIGSFSAYSLLICQCSNNSFVTSTQHNPKGTRRPSVRLFCSSKNFAKKSLFFLTKKCIFCKPNTPTGRNSISIVMFGRKPIFSRLAFPNSEAFQISSHISL
eukprot:Lithocolla_globosa_v1_NODE_1744_length_2366_cov_11.958027.p2 type:complete len:152 gc:universal NODE_1744_length_2366_cov_11.958027:620-1075(+)